MGIRLIWMRILFGALFVLVTYLTLTPDPEEAEKGFAAARFIAALVLGDPALADKVAHFAGYGALGASAFWAGVVLGGRAFWAPLLLAAYGAALEGVQGLGGVRSPELADAISNALGAFAGFWGAVLLAYLVRRLAAS